MRFKVLLFLIGMTLGHVCVSAEEKEAEKKDKASWEGAFSASANFVDGNSNSANQRFALDALRKMHDGSMNFYGEYNESSSEGKTSVRNNTFGLKYNYDISKNEYLFIGYEMHKDKFKNLDFRNKFLFGYGRKVIDEEKTKLNLEAGFAWVREDYIEDSLSTINVEAKEYWALRFANNFSHMLNENVELFQKAEYTPSLEDAHDYTITSLQGVRTKVTKTWSLESSVKLVYVNNLPKDEFENPVLRDNGRKVNRLDTYYFVGLNYSF